jgi:hypothetical protein
MTREELIQNIYDSFLEMFVPLDSMRRCRLTRHHIVRFNKVIDPILLRTAALGRVTGSDSNKNFMNFATLGGGRQVSGIIGRLFTFLSAASHSTSLKSSPS